MIPELQSEHIAISQRFDMIWWMHRLLWVLSDHNDYFVNFVMQMSNVNDCIDNMLRIDKPHICKLIGDKTPIYKL